MSLDGHEPIVRDLIGSLCLDCHEGMEDNVTYPKVTSAVQHDQLALSEHRVPQIIHSLNAHFHH